jgi:hypothetical protein
MRKIMSTLAGACRVVVFKIQHLSFKVRRYWHRRRARRRDRNVYPLY